MARLAIVLAGLFVLGLVIGGAFALATKPPASAPVAAASASPVAVTQAPVTPSAEAQTEAPEIEPTTEPTTATPSPATPVAVTPVTPTSTPAPPTATAPPPTATLEPPTPGLPTPQVADPADIPAFMEGLGRAVASGANRFMFQNLHPAVLDRYGEDACRQYTSTSSIPGLSLAYLSSEGPAAWDWVLDDVTTNIPDAWAVTVNWSQPGQADERREVHIAPADGAWRWFTDCGDPLT